MKRKLWIVTEVFYPDETATSYILTRIAEHLNACFDVHVICGPLDGDSCKASGHLQGDIHIIRHNGCAWNKNKLLVRLLRFIGISSALIFSSFKHISRNDEVLVVTNPAPMLLLFPLLKKWKGFYLTILVHDVFPENAIAARILKNDRNWCYKWLKARFDKAYARADRLVVLGRDMLEVMTHKIEPYKRSNISIEIIENWADTENIKPTIIDRDSFFKFDTSGKIILQYAGNIGRVQGLKEFLQCLYDSHNETLHLCIWGKGALENELREFVAQHNMTNVSFHGGYARTLQNNVLNSCDLAIVTLSEGMYGLGVPSKSYNIMAAGKPILYIGDPASEIAQTIRDQEIGVCFNRANDVLTNYLANLTIRDLPDLCKMGCKARIAAETNYSRKTIMQKFGALFNQ